VLINLIPQVSSPQAPQVPGLAATPVPGKGFLAALQTAGREMPTTLDGDSQKPMIAVHTKTISTSGPPPGKNQQKPSRSPITTSTAIVPQPPTANLLGAAAAPPPPSAPSIGENGESDKSEIRPFGCLSDLQGRNAAESSNVNSTVTGSHPAVTVAPASTPRQNVELDSTNSLNSGSLPFSVDGMSTQDQNKTTGVETWNKSDINENPQKGETAQSIIAEPPASGRSDFVNSFSTQVPTPNPINSVENTTGAAISTLPDLVPANAQTVAPGPQQTTTAETTSKNHDLPSASLPLNLRVLTPSIGVSLSNPSQPVRSRGSRMEDDVPLRMEKPSQNSGLPSSTLFSQAVPKFTPSHSQVEVTPPKDGLTNNPTNNANASFTNQDRQPDLTGAEQSSTTANPGPPATSAPVPQKTQTSASDSLPAATFVASIPVSETPEGASHVTLAGSTAPLSTSSAPVLSDANSGTVQVARIVQGIGKAEMHIDMRTPDFGSVEVHTTLRESQIGLTVGSEKGDLRGFLAPEVPSLQAVIHQQDLRLDTLHFLDRSAPSNASFAGSADPRSHSQNHHESRPQASAPAGEVLQDSLPPEITVPSTGSLSVHA